MNGMALFGWLILALITGYATFASIAYWYISNAFSGKTEGGVYVFLIIAGALWTVLYKTCPFTVVIQ